MQVTQTPIPRQEKPHSPATSELLSTSELSVERAPRLQILFEETCTATQNQLCKLSHVPVEMSLERVWSGNASEIAISDNKHIAVEFQLLNFSSSMWVSLDRTALYQLMEALLGATNSPRPYLEERDFTLLELAFAKYITRLLTSSFKQEFAVIIDMSSSLLSAKPGNEALQQFDDSDQFVIANIALDLFGRTGQLRLFIPQAVLAPMKHAFSSIDDDEQDSNDSIWTEHIKTQLQQTSMECKAIIDGGEITLGDAARLQVGQVFELDINPETPVNLTIDDEKLFIAKLGQGNGVFTVKIINPVKKQDSLLDTVLDCHTN